MSESAKGFVSNIKTKASELSQTVVPDPAQSPAPATDPKAPAKKPMNPCMCWGRNVTLRDGCITIGMSLVLIGLVNLVGIYFTPMRYNCQQALRKPIRKWLERYPESGSNLFHVCVNDCEGVTEMGPGSGRSGGGPENGISNPFTSRITSFKLPDEEKKRKDECDLIINGYIALNSIFLFVSAAAGVLLFLSIIKRKSVGALICCVLAILCVFLILGQAALVYQLSWARFLLDLAAAREDAQQAYQIKHDGKLPATGNSTDFPPAPNPVVGLSGQKALSIIGGIVFAGIYIYFSFTALVFYRYVKVGIDMTPPTTGNDGKGPKAQASLQQTVASSINQLTSGPLSEQPLES